MNPWFSAMNADGSDAHPVTSAAEKHRHPWPPDGTEIPTLGFPSRAVEVDETPREPGSPRPGGVQFVAAWQPHADDEDKHPTTIVRTHTRGCQHLSVM